MFHGTYRQRHVPTILALIWPITSSLVRLYEARDLDPGEHKVPSQLLKTP